MNLVVGEQGAVDLDKPPCGNCRWRTNDALCRRYPPIFIPPVPVMTEKGPAMQQATWAFPPAAIKCGEWTPRPKE